LGVGKGQIPVFLGGLDFGIFVSALVARAVSEEVGPAALAQSPRRNDAVDEMVAPRRKKNINLGRQRNRGDTREVPCW